MPLPFVSKRAPIYQDVPTEKWNDWRWQLSNRLNSAEDIEKVLPLTESERKALQTQGIFRVDVTPYFISLIDPNDPEDPIKGGMAAFDPALGRNVMIESFQLKGLPNADIKFLNKNVNHYTNPPAGWRAVKANGLPMPVAVKGDRVYDSRYGYYMWNIWQGAYVFSLDPEDGFDLKGKITHSDSTENSRYW